MSDRDDYAYPDRVCCEIPVNDYASYLAAAEHINRCRYDILSVQHEYGIFGGDAGNYLMALVREAKMPIVTTLHTVLREPSPAQKAVLDELLQLSERVIVMSEKAVGFLVDVHNVSLDKIDLIPHGIPLVGDARVFRESLGIDGPMILTFGLLSPDKGIQYVIEAMPKIVAEHVGATYVIVGATHPHVRASGGEAYRESLVALAQELGVAENVRFVDRFVAIEELVEYLGAMDFYVTPYLNPRQITSGTLAYSVGAGKAVISTPYWYAEELLAEGRGVLVPFRDADAIADAILALEGDPETRDLMGRTAAEFGKQMLWPEVGKTYLASFARAKQDNAQRLQELVRKPLADVETAQQLPALHLNHLYDLSDDTGILQHATFTVPNRSEGYCVDDNARALLLTAYLGHETPHASEIALLQSRYLSFVLDAYNASNGRFRNFMSYRREWLEEAGSEDSHGRSLWALGAMVNRCQDRGRREVAKHLFERSAQILLKSTSLRTWAYGILAADEYLTALPNDRGIQELMQGLASKIWREYSANNAQLWPWFEQKLTYANARIPQALILAGGVANNPDMIRVGLDTLSWLLDVQQGPEGIFVPISSEGYRKGTSERSHFDQQPIEAWSTMSACLCAHRATGSSIWLSRAHRTFEWFLGRNLLGQPLYDRSTGGCHDGLHFNRVNQNQGAESTLSFLCALTELREVTARTLFAESGRQTHEVR